MKRLAMLVVLAVALFSFFGCGPDASVGLVKEQVASFGYNVLELYYVDTGSWEVSQVIYAEENKAVGRVYNYLWFCIAERDGEIYVIMVNDDPKFPNIFHVKKIEAKK
jgi:hypothetical protein